MHPIPVEILHEILSYIPEKELGPVRMVNRACNNVATERYFRTLWIPVHDSTAKLLHIARRPELAHFVRHLIYPRRLLEPDPHEHFRSDKENPAWVVVSHALSKELNNRPKALDDPGFIEALRFTISKMPNLREISTNWIEDKSHSRRLEDWPEAVIVGDHTSTYSLECKLARAEDREDDLLGYCRAFMAAGVEAQIRLDKLSMYGIWRGIFTENTGTLWDSAPLFQNLTSLVVYFCTSRTRKDFEALREDANSGRIFKFLSSAPKLRRLALGLEWKQWGNFRERTRCVVPLLDIFGNEYVWEYLETFLFNGGPLHAEELMRFFDRHVGTLRTFGLYRPHLWTGSWRAVLDFIRERPGLCLEKLVLEGPSERRAGRRVVRYLSGCDGKSMSDYVLGEGAPFPVD
ncbi:hypothetical protein RUND412_008008 [Rhizina undulata]